MFRIRREPTVLDAIIALIMIFCYAFFINPSMTVIVTASGIGICIFIGVLIFIRRRFFRNTDARKNALNIAAPFLVPYRSIWTNLKLSNKNCQINLGADKYAINAFEKMKDYSNGFRKFEVLTSPNISYEELWNTFCVNFSYETKYDDLVSLCKTLGVRIKERNNNLNINNNLESTNQSTTEKTDINNASEVEITALPGINIIMSKRIIKKREEIGGFKSLNDLFIFLKLKPHIEKQLSELICIKKMKGSILLKRNEERSLDL